MKKEKKEKNVKKHAKKSMQKDLTNAKRYIRIKIVVGLSPNGKATDSDSVISRFKSL